MEMRRLGDSGLRVSPFCLGTMLFGGQTAEAEAARMVDAARAAGINFQTTHQTLSAIPIRDLR